MPGIQLSGLASGLDTQSLISQLMAVEEAPRSSITHKQSQDNQKKTLLQDLQTKLQTLSSAAADLSSPVTWNPTQEIDSSDTTKITATQTAGAGPGSYTLAVTQLASSEQRTFAYNQAANTNGDQINITNTSTGASEPITVAAGASIDDVAGAINADTNSGVFAVNVNGSLVLASRTTGLVGGFTATGSTLTEDTTKHRPAQQAEYSVDGTPQPPSDSNTLTAAIPGVSLTVKGTTTGTTVTVGNPGVDTGMITTKVKAFVDAYNDAMNTIRTDVSEQPSSSDPTKGSLYDDFALSGLEDAMRNSVGQMFSGIGNPDSMQLLAQAGVSTGATTGSGTFSQDSVDGKLTLDTTALTNALTSDPLSVQRLFGGATGVNGFAQSFSTVIQPFSQAGGIIDTELTNNDSDLKDLTDQLADFDQRMSDKQTYYQSMFTNLETSLSQLQGQSSSLASSLSGLGTTA
jgi:flagellar hook-associated protein 2